MDRSKLYYENALGERFNFTEHGTKVGFQSIDGLDGSDVSEITSRGYRQHGTTLEYLLMEEREVTINFYLDCINNSEYRFFRKNILNTFKPLVEGTLYYQDIHHNVMLNCHVESMPYIEVDDLITTGTGDVVLVANDPIWWDAMETPIQIGTWTGGFRTWDATHEFTMPFRLRQRADTWVEVNNSGQVPTPVTVEFSGQATNPMIYNATTDKLIRLDGKIASDEKVVITTGYRNKTITLYRNGETRGTPAEYMLDDLSEFFSLEPGINVIKFSCSDTNAPSDVTLRFRKGYYSI